MTFEIHSFEGALPLRFGMSQKEIVAAVGPPHFRDRDGSMDLYFSYDAFIVSFTSDDLYADHFCFRRGAAVTFRHLDFFGDRSAWRTLLPLSADYHEWGDFLVFCDLGVALKGFHGGGDDNPSVIAFPRGAWDKFRPGFKAFVFTSNA